MAQILETAGIIAREAGGLLNEFAQRRIGYELKGEHDLVTAADRASEKLIVERLTSAFLLSSIFLSGSFRFEPHKEHLRNPRYPRSNS